MKYFVCVMFFLLYACENINMPKNIKKNKKDQNIEMKIITKPRIKVKK